MGEIIGIVGSIVGSLFGVWLGYQLNRPRPELALGAINVNYSQSGHTNDKGVYLKALSAKFTLINMGNAPANLLRLEAYGNTLNNDSFIPPHGKIEINTILNYSTPTPAKETTLRVWVAGIRSPFKLNFRRNDLMYDDMKLD